MRWCTLFGGTKAKTCTKSGTRFMNAKYASDLPVFSIGTNNHSTGRGTSTEQQHQYHTNDDHHDHGAALERTGSDTVTPCNRRTPSMDPRFATNPIGAAPVGARFRPCVSDHLVLSVLILAGSEADVDPCLVSRAWFCSVRHGCRRQAPRGSSHHAFHLGRGLPITGTLSLSTAPSFSAILSLLITCSSVPRLWPGRAGLEAAL